MTVDELTVLVAGPPVAQGRPRFTRFAGGRELEVPIAYDPKRSRAWKVNAAAAMHTALVRAGAPRPLFPREAGALELVILAVFPLPQAEWRKTTVRGRVYRPELPDAENVAKAVQDAGTGLLWTDDAQVARLVVEKATGAQGEAPFVRLTVRPVSGLQRLALAIGGIS